MKIKKILSRLRRKYIFLFDGVSTKKYMRMYNKWLVKNGIDTSGHIKYINHSVFLDGSNYGLIHIGKDVVISLNTIILVHDFSIEAGEIACGKEPNCNEFYFFKDVFIGDGTFIGAGCLILCGSKIGKHCIVGAGSVLTGKTYPDYSLIAGNPAKVICDVRNWTKKKENSEQLFQGFFN